jgi:hypothetical protein
MNAFPRKLLTERGVGCQCEDLREMQWQFNQWSGGRAEGMKQPDGVEKNRFVVETLMGYLYEQGLAEKKLTYEELFAPNTFDL